MLLITKNPEKILHSLLIPLLIGFILFFHISISLWGEEENKEEDTITIAFSAGNPTLDPLHLYTTTGLEIATGIYEGLVTYHPLTMEPLPGVAERWEISDDGLTYKFFIRENAMYSNGDPVKASDFIQSWLRMINPNNNAEYSFFFDIIKGAENFRTGKTTNPKDVGLEAKSDRELVVKLKKPASYFLKLLCHTAFSPIHPKYLKNKSWRGEGIIIGNGPYLMYTRTDKEIILKKNNLYWDAKNVKTDTIEIRFMDNPTEISKGFQGGKIQWADDWDSKIIKNSDAIVAHPTFGTGYFFFVTNISPWDDYRVRKGIALLVPWEEIRKKHFMLPTSTLVPSIPQYPKIEGITKENDDEAFKLLKDAGFDSGRGLPDITIRIIRNTGAEGVAKELKKIWEEKLPVKVVLQSYDFRTYVREIKKGGCTLGASTWIGDFADPLTFLDMWTSNSNLNDAKYNNPEYDKLIEKSDSISGKERYELLSKAEKILIDKAVVIPLFNAPSFNLIDLEIIGGWFPNPLNIHPLKYLYYKEATLPPGVVYNNNNHYELLSSLGKSQEDSPETLCFSEDAGL